MKGGLILQGENWSEGAFPLESETFLNDTIFTAGSQNRKLCSTLEVRRERDHDVKPLIT